MLKPEAEPTHSLQTESLEFEKFNSAAEDLYTLVLYEVSSSEITQILNVTDTLTGFEFETLNNKRVHLRSLEVNSNWMAMDIQNTRAVVSAEPVPMVLKRVEGNKFVLEST